MLRNSEGGEAAKSYNLYQDPFVLGTVILRELIALLKRGQARAGHPPEYVSLEVLHSYRPYVLPAVNQIVHFN